MGRTQVKKQKLAYMIAATYPVVAGMYYMIYYMRARNTNYMGEGMHYMMYYTWAGMYYMMYYMGAGTCYLI